MNITNIIRLGFVTAIILCNLAIGIGSNQTVYALDLFLTAYDVTGNVVMPNDSGYFETFSSITFYLKGEGLLENENYVYAVSEDNGLHFSGFTKVEDNYLILTPPEEGDPEQMRVLQFLIYNSMTGENRTASDGNCLYRIKFDINSEKAPKAKLKTGSKVKQEDKMYIRGAAPTLYAWPCKGMKTYASIDDGKQCKKYNLKGDLFKYIFQEGEYKVEVWSEDASGNRAYADKFPLHFCYDNTKPTEPQFQIEINEKKAFHEAFSDYQYFSKEGICLKIESRDDIAGLAYLEYKYKSISGNVIQKINSDSFIIAPYFKGKISVRAIDRAGNITKWTRCEDGLVVENKEPEIEIENEKTEEKWGSENIKFKIRVSDKDSGIANVICAINGKKELTKDYKKGRSPLEICTINLEAIHEAENEEGVELEVYVYDNAGNYSRKTQIFYIDRTAPEITFKKIAEGDSFRVEKSLDIWIKEKIYKNGMAQLQIYDETSGERILCHEETIRLQGENTCKQVQVERDGSYVVEVSARDAAGNQSDTKTIRFCKDTLNPKVNIEGIEDYLITDKSVQGICRAEDTYLQEQSVQIIAIRYDNMGKIVEEVKIPVESDAVGSYGAGAFKEEGNYRLKIYASDMAGNEAFAERNFTIDKNPPVICGIDEYNGRYMKSFCLNKSPEELMEDYSITEYALYLNGMEYDGKTPINKEGKYVLNFCARDEMGHESKKTAAFIIDATLPEIQFAEKDNAIYIKTKNPKDQIKEILVNGENIEISKDGIYHLKSSRNKEIVIKAQDDASNTTEMIKKIS